MGGFPSETMEAEGNAPVAEPICPCNGGNRYWLENASGNSVSASFAAGGVASPILPQTASSDTRAINTVEGSGGPLTLTINGTTTTVLEHVDSSHLIAPEELRAGLVVGRRSSGPTPISADGRGILFTDEVEEVSIGQFLPGGVSEADTEIDLVCAFEGAPSEGACSPGTHSADSLSESNLRWFMHTLLLNTIVNSADTARSTVDDALRVFQVRSASQMRAFIRELIVDARFHVRPISSWGGKLAVIFKGRHTGRAFLTATMYGLRNSKVGYVSAYAQVAGGGPGTAGTVARGAAKGNLIGFLVATVIEVDEFIRNEDPEKNWGTFLGGLSVGFTKVFIAGAAGILLAGAVAASMVAAPVILVVGVGLAVSVAVGVGLELLDNALGISEGARRLGQALGTGEAMQAVGAFVDRVVQSSASAIEQMIDSWNGAVDNIIEDARRNDPRGYCALFCNNPLDQVQAWQSIFR